MAPPYEIEVKILDINSKDLQDKLVSLGAGKIFEGTINALYYDLPDRSLGARKDALRLRQEGTATVLTFKKYVDTPGAKVREEFEVSVSDFHSMRVILESLGFSSWLEMKKHRTTFELEGVHFEFDRHTDEYAYIPEFLEIEAAELDTIHRFAQLLGFSEKDCLPWDALQVAEHYRIVKGISNLSR